MLESGGYKYFYKRIAIHTRDGYVLSIDLPDSNNALHQHIVVIQLEAVVQHCIEGEVNAEMQHLQVVQAIQIIFSIYSL